MIRAKQLLEGVLPHRRWSLGLYSGPSVTEISQPDGFESPIIDRHSVTDVEAAFVADPFALYTGGVYHLFFEVLNAKTKRGEIGCSSSTNLRDWSYRGIVLRESFHLSYPQVSFIDGRYTMVPESYDAGDIRMYESENFPFRWRLASTLVGNVSLGDPTLLHHDDLWWIFACASTNNRSKASFRSDVLVAYYSESLNGPWHQHRNNPLVNGDPSRARPAGRFIYEDGRLLRPCQVAEPSYGSAIRFFEVSELSPSRFREHEIHVEPALAATGVGWNASGIHHIEVLRQPRGEVPGLYVVDGRSQRRY